jgi:hypothetical protein
MICVSWANSKLHASVSTGNFTACGLAIPSPSEQDVIYDFSGAPPTCKRCLKHLGSQERARLEAQHDMMMRGKR